MTAEHGDGAVPGRHSADGENAAAPRFDVVVRGYDRRQVDEHIAGLERTLARQRTDLEQARGGANGTNGANGTAQARSGAAALFNAGTGSSRPTSTDSSGGLTPEMISAFTTRLQSILQAAEEEAEEVRTNARNFARKEEDAGRVRLAEMERRRETMLGDLGRVRSQLDTVLSTASKETPIGGNLPPPPTPPEGLPPRGDKGPGGQPGKRPEQAGGPRVGPLPVTDGNRPRPAQRPEHQNAQDGHGRPVNRPPAPNQGAKPMGTGPQGNPAQQTGPQKSVPSPHPKPHPTPSPRPRTNQPAQGNAGVPGGAAQGTREAAGARGPVDQHARNGVINRENGAPPARGDETDGGRPGFGNGAR